MAKASHEVRGATTPLNRRNLSIAKRSWLLKTAKARLEEVFRLARTEAPQLITRHGKEGVVILPVEQFDELVVRSQHSKGLVQFLRQSPLVRIELDLARDKDTGRDIEL
jgi:antitoxin Phd